MKKRIIAACLALLMLVGIAPVGIFTATAQTENSGRLIAYPEFDRRIERDYLYSVSVTDSSGTTALPVYNHTEDSRTARNTEDGTADEYRRFSTFAFDNTNGSITVNIKVNRDFTSYSVIPSAKNFPSTFDAATGTIKVTLEKPEYFMVRLDGKDSTNIAIFADAPETETPTASANTIVIDGWHEVEGGVLNITTPDTTVYIKPGAVLNARIKITADRCRVIGRGAMVDPFGNIFTTDERNGAGEYVFLFVYDADDAVIDGIHLLNSRAYNLQIQGDWGKASYAENASVKNVKIMSTQMSSDGICFNYYNKGSVAEHCFIHCGDNALNYEDNATYRDILVGTTCNAIFPQTDVRNSTLENIYVFRSNDNIINTEYTGSNNQTLIDNHKITNLYAQDVTYTTSFFYAENPTTTEAPVKSSNGGTTITNVCLPKIDGIRARFYYNISVGNHEVTLKNVYVGGTAISSIDTATSGNNKTGTAIANESWGWISYPSTHAFKYVRDTSVDIPSSTPKTAHKVTVNYSNKDTNVFIGSYQAYFANPVIKEGSTVLLPYEEIKTHLGVGASSETVERGGIKYIAHDKLQSAGMVSGVSLSGNKLTVTPYNQGNLLVEDNNSISRFTEYRASHQYLICRDGVYTVINIPERNEVEGIFRVINEEIKKYGTGSYTLGFKVRSDDSAGQKLSFVIDYGAELGEDILKTHEVTLGSDWQEGSFDFSISSSLLSTENLSLIVYDAAKVLSSFEIKDITLTKSENAKAAHSVTWDVLGSKTTQKHIEGTLPQFDGVTEREPRKFIGWSPEVASVTSDVTYVAQYKAFEGMELYGTQMRESDGAVRFVGVLDDYQREDIEELGFVIKVGEQSADCEISKVYSSILVNGAAKTPQDYGYAAGTTFFTFCLSDIPAWTKLEVGIYAVTSSGARVESTCKQYTYTGNDIVLPGLHLRDNNSTEDIADFNSLFGGN